MLCSFKFLSKLMRAEDCAQFCLNPYCEEYESCLPQDKNNSDKTVHNLQLTTAWTRS